MKVCLSYPDGLKILVWMGVSLKNSFESLQLRFFWVPLSRRKFPTLLKKTKTFLESSGIYFRFRRMNENVTQIPRTQALLLFFHFLHEYKPKARKTRSGEFEFVWKNTRVIWATRLRVSSRSAQEILSVWKAVTFELFYWKSFCR